MNSKSLFSLAALSLLAALPAHAADERAMTQEARELSIALQKTLGSKLMAQIEKGGPASAIGVCKTLGPEIAADMSRQSGLRVTRVSLKVRNPVLGMSDAWEQQMLREFDARIARGDKPETLEHAATVIEPEGKFFRYMKALPVQPLCVNCHGTPDRISAEVAAQLAKDYPHDKAVGYAPGQVRGAISIKRPL